MKRRHTMSVLVIDDEPDYGAVISRMLGSSFRTECCTSGTEGLALLGTNHFDFVLCDVQMPELPGLELLEQAQSSGILDDGTTFIMISAYGTLDTALACLKAGAYDYISKPFKPDEVRLTLEKAVERERLRGRVHELEAALGETFHFDSIVARAPSMRHIFDVLRKVADYRTTVLITGESGTGKELVARALHRSSGRRSGYFVAVNCGAIPENLLESELFGYVRGAFTDAARDKKGLFEQAHGGTLFLDEIGDLPVLLQVKLLRALQEQEIRRIGDTRSIKVDVRVIAATAKNLVEAVAAGAFREDLFYRLNVIPIRLPPLRERPEDVPLLVDHFVEKINQRHGTSAQGFTPDAMRDLIAYPWPGNVRELENLVERVILLSEGSILGRDDLPENIIRGRDPARFALSSGNLSIKKAFHHVEEALIRRALEQTEGNRTHAAKLLEISHRALLYKIKDYHVEL